MSVFPFFGQIFIHAVGYFFGILDGLDNVPGAEYDIAAREYTFAGGGAGLVDFNKALVVGLDACSRADNLVFWLLADGNDGAECFLSELARTADCCAGRHHSGFSAHQQEF